MGGTKTKLSYNIGLLHSKWPHRSHEVNQENRNEKSVNRAEKLLKNCSKSSHQSEPRDFDTFWIFLIPITTFWISVYFGCLCLICVVVLYSQVPQFYDRPMKSVHKTAKVLVFVNSVWKVSIEKPRSKVLWTPQICCVRIVSIERPPSAVWWCLVAWCRKSEHKLLRLSFPSTDHRTAKVGSCMVTSNKGHMWQ